MAQPSKPRLAGPSRPLGDPDIPQFHLPATASPAPHANQPDLPLGLASSKVVFAPRVYGAAHVLFADLRRGVHETRRVAFLVPIELPVRAIDWEAATPTSVMPADLRAAPPVAGGAYLPLPAGAMRVPTFTRWAKSFDRWLARTQRIVVPVPSPSDSDNAAPVTIAPKHGGVNVELVAIVWERI